MDAATKFIGGAISRRVKRAYEERVVPTVAAKQDAMLREQIAIAERYPDLRACLTDNVGLPGRRPPRGADVQPQPGFHPGAGRRRRGPATERLIRAPRPVATPEP